MANWLSRISSLFSSSEKRSGSSAEFESAVNAALLGATVSDNASLPVITPEGALNLSAVWACVRILSDTVGTLPIHLFRRDGDDRIPASDHPLRSLLAKPNSYTNKFYLIQHLMVGCALWGNGYVRIFRDNNFRPERLQLLKPYDCTPYLNDRTEELFYRTKYGEIVPAYDMIHLRGLSSNGYEGLSPIAVHRENLQLTEAAQRYGVKFFNQGGNMSGVFKYPSVLKPESYERLKRDLLAQSTGMHNAHTPLLLEGGMTYERISIPPDDAQFIATRKFQKTEIATIYGVPPHMIADLERATNNNIEQQAMEFVQYCLLPYIIKLEEEFNRKLLREDEFDSLFFKFNVNGLLRADVKSRGEWVYKLYLIGAITANEVRHWEELNSYSGGDVFFRQANMLPVNELTNMLTSAQGTTNDNLLKPSSDDNE